MEVWKFNDEGLLSMPAARPEDAHDCPWLGCTGWARPTFWGCPTHWAMLPAEMQRNWIRSEPSESLRAVQEESIQQYIRRLQASLAPFDAQHAASESEPHVVSGAKRFTCGFTTDGDVFMFWPADRQYVLIAKDDVAKLRELFA